MDTAVTVMEIEGNLREEKKRRPEKAIPGWQIRIESRIEAIRRKLLYTYVLTECCKNRRYMRHQNTIKSKMEKWYGKISINKLKSIQVTLKQEFATAVTVMEIEGNLREEKKRRPEKAIPGWQIRIESRIEAIRRKLLYTYVLTECCKNRRYMRHQNTIKSKMEKWYGKISINKLKSIQVTLKQELAIGSQKLKRRKTVQERWRINGLFKVAPKKVYRSMKGDGGKPVSEMPTKKQNRLITFGDHYGVYQCNITVRHLGWRS